MKKSIVFFWGMLAVAAFAQNNQVEIEELPNIQNPREGVMTGGQPLVEGLKTVKEMGFRVVVNLREDGEGGSFLDERSQVEKVGMAYIHIPMSAETITEEKVKAFGDAVTNKDGMPVFVHCASGNRVGAMWLLHRVRNEGATVDAALDEARGIGLKPELEATVLKWLGKKPAAKSEKSNKEKPRKDAGKGAE